MKDFFISYTRTDQAWAEWIAWTLEAAGYSTVIQAWDFLEGSNFVLEMQRAATEANRTIAVLSQKYLESSQSEWAAAFGQDPQGKKQKLVPVRIEACQLTGLLASIVYLDLVGLPENDARTALLGAFSIPASAPAFPGTRTPQAPGVSPTQPAYPGATETMSASVAEILAGVAENAENADQDRRLSVSQRLQFIRQLNEIAPQQFNMLLFAVNPPAGLIPPMPAPQGDRISALLMWAEAPGGCGLSVLQQLLDTIVKLPVGPPPPVTGPATPFPPQENERVVAHGDAPAIVDQLERDTFAEVIATRIKEVWKARRQKGSRTEDVPIGAFMIHVHGPWGSGKTSVLNFLSTYLKKEDPSEQHDKKEGPSNQWVIVNFNAWRYQRIRPPWWTLIREIYVQSVHSVGFSRSLTLRVSWWLWRIQADWLPVVSAAVLMAVAVLLASGVIKFTPHQRAPASASPSPPASASPSPPASASPSPTASAMELGLKVLTAVLAAGASLVAFSRSLVFGSARAAQTYIDLKSDPLRPIINIFENVVKAIKRPVVVFVDDLDRCESKYVVELLEGIQTLFREAPITYVVAADRKWICSSFEKEYDAFGKTIGEPGRPMGYLFLDKMFQISVSVPRLLPEVQRRYWEALLRARASNDSESASAGHEQVEREQAKLKALDEMKAVGADTPEKLQEMIDSALGDPLREQAIRAAAATQVTSPPVSQKSEHRLQPFAPLLEPNPRSMKRLVNAYGMHLATHFLEGRPVSPESIARWTIIELRWPLLADFLAARPQSVAALARGKILTPLHSIDNVEKPQELEKLYDDEEVKAVLGYGPKGAMALDEHSIRQIVG
jgi:hypothetical protein